MPGPAPILRELSRIRRHIKELETKAESGPRAIKAQQNKLAQQEAALEATQEQVKQLKMRIHEQELSVKATQQQIKKYEAQRNEAKSKKEYDTLGAEIAHGEGVVHKLEDGILELMGEVEDKSRLIPDAEKVVLKGKADFAQFERDQTQRLQLFAQEKERAYVELASTEATLPADARELYLRLVKAKGADALAGVNGATCCACYTDVTPQMQNQLIDDQLLVCKNCGRILYREG